MTKLPCHSRSRFYLQVLLLQLRHWHWSPTNWRLTFRIPKAPWNVAIQCSKFRLSTISIWDHGLPQYSGRLNSVHSSKCCVLIWGKGLSASLSHQGMLNQQANAQLQTTRTLANSPAQRGSVSRFCTGTWGLRSTAKSFPASYISFGEATNETVGTSRLSLQGAWKCNGNPAFFWSGSFQNDRCTSTISTHVFTSMLFLSFSGWRKGWCRDMWESCNPLEGNIEIIDINIG